MTSDPSLSYLSTSDLREAAECYLYDADGDRALDGYEMVHEAADQLDSLRADIRKLRRDNFELAGISARDRMARRRTQIALAKAEVRLREVDQLKVDAAALTDALDAAIKRASNAERNLAESREEVRCLRGGGEM